MGGKMKRSERDGGKKSEGDMRRKSWSRRRRRRRRSRRKRRGRGKGGGRLEVMCVGGSFQSASSPVSRDHLLCSVISLILFCFASSSSNLVRDIGIRGSRYLIWQVYEGSLFKGLDHLRVFEIR